MLDNGQVEHRELRRDNAPADCLSAPLASVASVPTKASVTDTQEQIYAVLCEHSLLHREALLVLPAHDLEHIAFELLQSGKVCMRRVSVLLLNAYLAKQLLT